MARIRSIKPQFWSDERIAELSHPCALFFIGLWNFCDDEGKCKNSPRQLSLSMPMFRSQDIQKWVTTLENAGLIQTSTKREWLLVTNWHHQRIDRPVSPSVKREEIQWNEKVDSTSARESSSRTRRKDRIGEDRIGTLTKVSGEVASQTSNAVALAPLRSPQFLKGMVKAEKEISKISEFIKFYVETYQRKFGKETRPSITGKVQGQIKTLLKDHTLEEARQLLEAYLQMDDAWFQKKAWDFTTFMENLQKVSLAKQTGRNDPSVPETNWDKIFGKVTADGTP